MKTMAIMIGIPASGKSTFCKTALADYVRVNLDMLHTRHKEMLAIEKAVSAGEDVVIDNTNPTVTDRERYIQIGKAAGYRIIGYFMQSQIKACIERNEGRTGNEHVPIKAIAAISNRLQVPSYEEGFDELYFVSITDGRAQISEWRREK